MSDEKEWLVEAAEGQPGQVILTMAQPHEFGKPGQFIEKELSLFEMECLHTAIVRALWFQIRNALPNMPDASRIAD